MKQICNLLALIMVVAFTSWCSAAEFGTTATTTWTLVEQTLGFEQQALYDQASSYVKAGRLKEAEHLLDQILESFRRMMRKPGAVYVSLATKAELEKFKAKQQGDTEVVWLHWTLPAAMQMKAFIAVSNGDSMRAVDLLTKQIAIAPYAASPYTEFGYILNQLKRPAAALEAYTVGLRLAREFKSSKSEEPAALRGIGFSLIELGQLKKAEAVLRESLKIDPGNAVALNELKYIKHFRKNAHLKEIRSHLMNAADAQALYFAKNKSYKSCAACTAKNLPGYEDNPNVTLVAEVGKTDFVLVATHLGCGDDIWTYQKSTGTIAEPSNECNNAPSY